jgi:hypothetical protein
MSTAPRWTTSSYADSADTKPAELEALRQHLTQCSAGSGRVAALQCGWLRLRGFVVSRLVTTLALLAAGAAGAAFLLL